MNESVIKKEVRQNFPDFVFQSLVKIGEGMDSLAFLVNDSLIFRFPKDQEIRINLRKEICALPILEPQLEVKIPKFKYIGADASFVGYEKIEGEMLTKELFYSFSPNQQKALQKSLAEFLQTVHRQNIAKFTACGIEIQDCRAEYESDFANIRKYVFPLVSSQTQQFITQQFHGYLNDEKNFSFQPVLLHNDLSADHIFVDSERAQVTGIIDFGDIGIGDGDYDLMYLLDDYGEDFVRSFLNFYPHDNHELLFQKLYFWGLVDTLQLITHYCEEQNTTEIKELLKYLTSWIEQMKNRDV